MKVSKRKLQRMRAGLRQIDLAQRVNVSPGTISLYEDETRNPSPELARELNKIIGAKVYSEKRLK